MTDEQKKFEDIAKIGSELLKKTVSSGLDVLMDLKGNIPKEAASFVAQRKEELMKGLSKEFIQSIITSTVDTLFHVIRQHRLEVSVALRKNEPQVKTEVRHSQEAEPRSHRPRRK